MPLATYRPLYSLYCATPETRTSWQTVASAIGANVGPGDKTTVGLGVTVGAGVGLGDGSAVGAGVVGADVGLGDGSAVGLGVTGAGVGWLYK